MGSRDSLALNTDGIIIFILIVHEEASQAGLKRREEKKKKKMGAELQGRWHLAQSCTIPSSRFFEILFVSGGIAQSVGELSEGNKDINLP